MNIQPILGYDVNVYLLNRPQRYKQAFKILKNVKTYHFLFGNPWISMPSWVLFSIFKRKIDHIGGKNKFQINFGKNLLWIWIRQRHKFGQWIQNLREIFNTSLHRLPCIINFKPNCRMQWIFTDLETEDDKICYNSRYQILFF